MIETYDKIDNALEAYVNNMKDVEEYNSITNTIINDSNVDKSYDRLNTILRKQGTGGWSMEDASVESVVVMKNVVIENSKHIGPVTITNDAILDSMEDTYVSDESINKVLDAEIDDVLAPDIMSYVTLSKDNKTVLNTILYPFINKVSCSIDFESMQSFSDRIDECTSDAEIIRQSFLNIGDILSKDIDNDSKVSAINMFINRLIEGDIKFYLLLRKKVVIDTNAYLPTLRLDMVDDITSIETVSVNILNAGIFYKVNAKLCNLYTSLNDMRGGVVSMLKKTKEINDPEITVSVVGIVKILHRYIQEVLVNKHQYGRVVMNLSEDE